MASQKVHAVQHEGGRPLAQQEEAAVRAALQPRRPEAQTAVRCVHIVQQPAQELELEITIKFGAASSCVGIIGITETMVLI